MITVPGTGLLSTGDDDGVVKVDALRNIYVRAIYVSSCVNFAGVGLAAAGLCFGVQAARGFHQQSVRHSGEEADHRDKVRFALRYIKP